MATTRRRRAAERTDYVCWGLHPSHGELWIKLTGGTLTHCTRHANDRAWEDRLWSTKVMGPGLNPNDKPPIR